MRHISTLLLSLFCSIIYAQEQIEVINIENPAVRAYMADRTYHDNPGEKTSVICQYKNTDLYGPNLDWPAGKDLQWLPTVNADSILEVRITVSEAPDFSNAVTHYPNEKTDSTFVIRNTIPGRTYYYKVDEIHTDATAIQLLAGAFRTEGQVRMIQVRGAHNVRDLGGWPTQYGVPIKYGKLYRSASLDAVKRQGIHDFVDNLNVRAELDLRGEVHFTQSPLGPDVDYLLLPHQSYTTALTSRQHVLVKDLEWIVARLKEGKSVDWHCAIGCDRCGTVSFLIEGLLGMYEIDLCRDYELSTLAFTKVTRQQSAIRNLVSHIRRYGPADDLAQCFYNYWISIGAAPEDLNYLLNAMLGIPIW